MIRALICAALLAGAGIAPAVMAEGDLEKGRLNAQTCMGCHGAPGMRNAYPGYRVPKLGGQHPEYIVAALQAYRSKLRSHPTMRAQAANLSDEDMADIAAYFSSLKKISTQ
jgi:cytochrome c553